MKKYIVERNLPGAENLSPEELKEIAQRSSEVMERLGKFNYWIQSYVTADKIYCIHIAENEASIRTHARLLKFPVNTIAEIKFIIDPLTGNAMYK